MNEGTPAQASEILIHHFLWIGAEVPILEA